MSSLRLRFAGVVLLFLAVLVLGIGARVLMQSREVMLDGNRRSLETAIARYRFDHLGDSPVIQDRTLPQLLAETNARGSIGQPSPEHPFGPYLCNEIPINPVDGSRNIVPVKELGQRPTAIVGTLGGWQYDPTTGAVWPNHREFYTESHKITSGVRD